MLAESFPPRVARAGRRVRAVTATVSARARTGLEDGSSLRHQRSSSGSGQHRRHADAEHRGEDAVTEPRRALVTGANRGLGRAVADRLHQQGWRVVVAARDPERAAEASAELGARACPVGLDVTDPDSVARAHHQVGAVDAVVCNAGVLLDGGTDPLSVPLDLVARTLAVNLLGSWRVCQAFVPAMVARGWGRVVMVSSGTGAFSNGLFTGAPGYSVSKTALNGLTTMLAEQTRGTGVLVNAVNPGLVRTRMMPRATRPAGDAAADVVDAVLLPDDGVTGAFLRHGRPIDW
jgi:NAD(P)-dependent dehydrogenase (short-subunit alcohol dehydrogenase family)